MPPGTADVLIVGAGPAGATAAKLLAETGRSVLLIDAVPPGKRAAERGCGGWVSRMAGQMFPWLARAIDKLVDLPFSGLTFHSPDFTKSAGFEERGHSGWLVDRAVFDAGLAQIATAAGAEMRTDRRVLRVAFEEELVRVHCEGGHSHAGRVLLAADGADSLIAGQCWRGRRPPPGMLGIGTRIAFKPAKLEKLLGRNRSLQLALAWGGLDGYAYVNAGRSAVSVGLLGRNLEAAHAPGLLAQFLAAATAKGLLPPDPDEAPPAPVLRRVPAGAALESDDQVAKRVLFLGDAGGFAGAVAGEGIFPAMWSAKLAADAVTDAFKAAKFQDALLTYKSRWRTEMAEHLRMPNTNMTFLLPLIFSNRQMTERFAKAVLYGKNI